MLAGAAPDGRYGGTSDPPEEAILVPGERRLVDGDKTARWDSRNVVETPQSG